MNGTIQISLKVKISVEYAVRLSAVQMPDEELVNCGRLWCHHAVDPVGVEESLIDDWRLVVELTIHRQVVTALEWDGSASANFFSANSNTNADLAGHRGTADDWLVQFEDSNDFTNGSNVAFFSTSSKSVKLYH